MRIVQTVFGVFHHFDLAREMERRGHLERIYSTWPWERLKREGVSRQKVGTFPWLHVPDFLLTKYGLSNRWISDQLGYANAVAFDDWTTRNLPQCDALIGISGSSLKAGQLAQRRGGLFLCDRGSSHQRYQAELNREEYLRWGLDIFSSDPRDTVREEEIYEVADSIVVPSLYSQRSFIQMGIPAEKLSIIPYGVRLERFQKVADPNPDAFEVLYVGGVSMHKGFPYLLQAFADLKHPRKRLRFAGSVRPEMKPILARLPQEQVEFLGSIPQTQLREIMSRSHVLVLPSIDDGFGMVISQAMACGCPVIATDHSGGPDILTEGVDGWVVPIRDPQAILTHLEQLAQDSALQQRMSAAAIQKVASLGGWERYGDQWEGLLFKLTGCTA